MYVISMFILFECFCNIFMLKKKNYSRVNLCLFALGNSLPTKRKAKSTDSPKMEITPNPKAPPKEKIIIDAKVIFFSNVTENCLYSESQS